MMLVSELREAITQFFEAIRNDIISEHLAQNQRATGRTLDSLEVVIPNDNSGQLWGASYIRVLEDGRKPGKFPPVGKIAEWIKAKGITPKINNGKKITKMQLSFVIARAISIEGTVLFRKGGKSGVLSKAINESRIQNFLSVYADKYVKVVTTELVEAYK